ncbi:MAG: hypothetical protein ACRDQW_14760 [Haloechinothrix sp.]
MTGGSRWESFLAEVTSASWLATVLGSMIGVAIGAAIALVGLRKQLRHDRVLFLQGLAAEREKQRRDHRQGLTHELAAALAPAGRRLAGHSGHDDVDVDFWADESWPDYKSTSQAVQQLETRLYVVGLRELYLHVLRVLNICAAAWGGAARQVRQCIDENPGDYAPRDPRVASAMTTAMVGTARRDLQTLETILWAWDGEKHLEFPGWATADELNNTQQLVRSVMTEPLDRGARLRSLQDQVQTGAITEAEFLRRVRDVLGED